MKLFEGKTKSERNKTIDAIVLGAACIVVLFFAFGRGMFSGSSTTATAKPTPTPKKTATVLSNPGKLEMPSKADRDLSESATPILYEPSRFGAPDAGRNIFAFYEPGKPTPYVAPPGIHFDDATYTGAAAACLAAASASDPDSGDQPAKCLRGLKWFQDGVIRRQIHPRYQDLF